MEADDLTRHIRRFGDNTDPCYVCGQANQAGLRIRFVRVGDQGSRASYTARVEHDGWPGVLHGGITFALMDEALAWASFFQGLRTVTARVQTKFKQPILTGTSLTIRGWTIDCRHRLITVRAEVRIDDESAALVADMDATRFLLTDNDQQRRG